MLDLQEFTPVPELLDDPVVTIVLMNDKVTIVALKIMGDDIHLSCVIVCQSIQPFQEISDAMVSRETHGLVILISFGHDEISDVFFMGLHGFNIKKHVQGWQVLLLLLLLLWGCLRLCGCCPSFGARTSTSFPLSLLLFLRLCGSLNKTSMGFTIHVLMARTAIDIVAAMPFNVL